MELGQYDEALKHLKTGRDWAADNVVKSQEGIIYHHVPQTELIKEAEKLITKIDKKKRKINLICNLKFDNFFAYPTINIQTCF